MTDRLERDHAATSASRPAAKPPLDPAAGPVLGPPRTGGYTPVPRRKQQVGGLLIAVAGLGLAAAVHRQAVRDGQFLMLGAWAGPAFAVIGAALVVWPGYKEERLARGERIDHLEGLALLTPRWKGVLAAALLAAGGYTLALSQGWF